MNDNIGFWQRGSYFYSIQEKNDKKLYDQIAFLASSYLNITKSVLELGCGTGQLAIRLKDSVKSYIATDYSSNMIKIAKKRNMENVCFKVMDATKIDYPNASFDVIIAANMLHIVPDPSKVLLECHRVLKPRGILIVPTFIYDYEPNDFKLRLLKLLGFKIYNKWSSREFKRVILNHGYMLLETEPIPAKIAGYLFWVAKNV